MYLLFGMKAIQKWKGIIMIVYNADTVQPSMKVKTGRDLYQSVVFMHMDFGMPFSYLLNTENFTFQARRLAGR